MNEKVFEFLISIVCYGNENEVCSFLNQLDNQRKTDSIAVAITINKAHNPQIIKDFVKDTKVKCFVFEPNINLGYLNGCLYGIKKLSENINYNWALMCNTDITFLNSVFFETISSTEYEEGIWGIAPSIQLPDHTFQNPYISIRPTREEMKRQYYIFSKYYLFYAYNFASEIKKIIVRCISKNRVCSKSQIVYAAHGSCMIFRKEMVKLLIAEENDIFLYCEEEYLAGLIYENGKKVLYDNQLQVLHNEHQTLGKIDYRKKQNWYIKSLESVIKRFYMEKK